MSESSSNVMFKLDFFMAPSIVVLDTQYRISRYDLYNLFVRVLLRK